jgi:hypothetical protein
MQAAVEGCQSFGTCRAVSDTPVIFQGMDLCKLGETLYSYTNPRAVLAMESTSIEVPERTLLEKTGSASLTIALYLVLPVLGHIAAFAMWAYHRFAANRRLASILLASVLTLVTMGSSMLLMLVAMCAPSCMTLSAFFQVGHLSVPSTVNGWGVMQQQSKL